MSIQVALTEERCPMNRLNRPGGGGLGLDTFDRADGYVNEGYLTTVVWSLRVLR